METANIDTQIMTGRKVFFINPNLTMFPESFCEDFLTMGFECYFMLRDSLLSLESKLEVLVNSFGDIILFFFIDAPDPTKNITWMQFIKALNMKYQNTISIGIMYAKRPSKYDNEQLQFLYQNEAKATCGAYALDYDKKRNFNTILEALVSNHARGRRKNVRVLCSTNCKIRFRFNCREYFESLVDLSLSHFTCNFDLIDFPAQPDDLFEDIEFNIRGIHFSHSAKILFLRLSGDDKLLCVFAFTDNRGNQMLDEKVEDMLIPKLYSMLNENFRNLFFKIYETNNKRY